MPAPGQFPTVGPYRLVRRRGAGGMGVVYLGYDPRTGAAAAVKLIRPEYAADPESRSRLRREVAAARRVPRFCTAPVLDADLDGDQLWVATEYVDGPDLDTALLQQGTLTGPALESLAVGLAVALRAIHQHGVIHRDLKPSNVLLSPLGPRVIDFGIARIEDDALEHLTQTGVVIGTPAFMAPEQLRREPLTTAVDVFAWAGLVSCAATGRRPFGTGPPALQQILYGEPDLGDLPEPMRTLVAAAFAKDPAARPSASELVDRLTGIAPATVSRVVASAAAVPTVPSLPVPPAAAPPAPAGATAAPAVPVPRPPGTPPWSVPASASVGRTRRWAAALAAGGAALAVLVAATVTAVLLTGDGSRDGGPAGGAAFEGTLALGGLMPTSGPLAEQWAGAVAAAQLAVSDINAAGGVWGSEVEWTLRDEFSTADLDRTVSLAQDLAAQGVHAVIGPVYSESTLAVIETLYDEQILMVSPVSTAPGLTGHRFGEYFFRTVASEALEGGVLADLILADGHATLAILGQRGRHGEGPAEVVDQRYTAAGGRVVHQELFAPLHEQLRLDVTVDTAALVDADPDALVLAAPFPGVEAIIRALVQDGFTAQDAQWYLTGGSVYEYGPSLPAGTLAGVVGIQRIVEEAPDEFLVRVEESAGDLITYHLHLAESYDAVAVVALAAIAADSDDPAAIRDQMVAVTTGGTRCVEFAACKELLLTGADIDYDGYGGVEWNQHGEPVEAPIGVFEYGAENIPTQIDVVTGRR